MPPKKRKLTNDEENSTDEEKSNKITNFFSKRTKNNSSESKEDVKAKKSNGLKFGLEWDEHGKPDGKNIKPLYYLWSKILPGCKKVASFDIDCTIIVTKSGKNFATNANDWTWFDKNVPSKLKELHNDGFRIVFFTNQAGIEKLKVKFSELKTKFQDMLIELDIPVFIFVSTGENHFRKPNTEMWTFFAENCNQGVELDMKESFYCGDAAGRVKNWAPGKKKDFSCGDRMFASNLSLTFYTPEEYFLKHSKSVTFEWGSIDPIEALKNFKSIDSPKSYHKTEQELVLMQGPPASGKSTFSKTYLIPFNYFHVNRDTLQTQEKCLKAAENALKEGKSVVIDNTNPSQKSRADYIKLAKKYNVKSIRCFVLNTPIELCHHLNYVRQNYTRGEIRRIPDVGYNMFKSQFEEINQSEGFTEIIKIDFSPKFENEQHEKIFKLRTN